MTDGAPATTSTGLVDRVYDRLVRSEVHDPQDGQARPGDADQHVARNAVHTVGALTLTKIGDRIVDAKTVLTWLMATLGAPSALTGLLVPVRESGALLPQVLVARFVAGRPRRQPTWLVGALGQATAVAAMAVIAVTLRGVVAGVALVGALAVFATFRSVCSLTIKDVMGRTIPTGERGQVTGWATTASGLVAITVGLGIRALGADAGRAVFGALLAAAAVLWLASAGVFLRVREPAVPDDHDARAGVAASLRLLVTDQPFRRFVIARTLLLVSALTPPYVVLLAQRVTGSEVAGLGPYVIASGVASLVGGRLWGPFADRSSRRLVAFASGAASVLVLVFLAGRQLDVLGDAAWWYVATYFAIALVHQGARLGRSTYVVDLGDTGGRTDYVAVSNTAMGVLLLVVGGLSALVALAGPTAALLLLSGIGLVGVPVSLSMAEVGAGRTR